MSDYEVDGIYFPSLEGLSEGPYSLTRINNS